MRFVIAATLTLAVLAAATDPGDCQVGGVKAKGKIPTGWKKLALSADQEKQVRGLYVDYNDKIVKLTKELADLKTELRTKQVAVLTADQKKILAMIPGDEPKKKDDK